MCALRLTVMTAWICVRCGAQYADTASPPEQCAVCADEREHVQPDGQRWTTLTELAAAGHRTKLWNLEPGLVGIGVEPAFAIDQRALLVRTPGGNLLWDSPGFLDDAAIDRVRELGGLAAIAASHPHLYGVQVEWSQAFGGVPIFVAEADQRWVMRLSPSVELWAGTQEVLPGVTLIQCGGHFSGSAVLHWSDGANGQGALLVGDTLMVIGDRRHVSFMRSYPNLIPLPLPARDIERILAALAPYPYDRIYGGWSDLVIEHDGREAVQHSANRYLAWLHGSPTS